MKTKEIAPRKQTISDLKKDLKAPCFSLDLHQDILLNLFNPQPNKNLVEYEIRPNKSIHSLKRIHVSCNVNLAVTFTKEKILRLPTMAECKMFLWIWKLAMDANTRTITFKNVNEFLDQIGYAVCADNYNLILNTLQVFQRLNIEYFNYSFTILNDKLKEHYEELGYLLLVPLEGAGLKINHKNELESVAFTFQKSFWELNRLDANGLIRKLNPAHIHNFKSPLTIKLYLYFVKWTKDDGTYIRNFDFEINDFRNILGFNSIENPDNIKMFKFQLKKALKEIQVVNAAFRFSLNEEKFDNKNNRMISFIKIAEQQKIERKMLPKRLIKGITS